MTNPREPSPTLADLVTLPLAELLDRHWLTQAFDGVAYCTCDEWTFDAKSGQHPLPVLGERFLPFSEHVASVVRAALAESPARSREEPGLDGRSGLADAVITALDVYGTMGNGEGWTMELDVIGTLWLELTPPERARTGYDVAAMDARIADGLARREGRGDRLASRG